MARIASFSERSSKANNSLTYQDNWEKLANGLADPGLYRQLATLLKNPDLAFQAQEKLSFARQLQNSGQEALAAEAFFLLAGEAGAPGSVREEAKRGGSRAELILNRVVRESTDLRVLLPMAGASLVGNLGRSFLAARSWGSAASWLTRGIGGRWTAGSVGFGLETLAFTAAQRAARGDTDRSFGEDWASAALSLGAMKAAAWGGGSAAKALSQNSGFALPALIGHGGSLAGLLAAQRLEIFAGLRPSSDAATGLGDALGAWLSLSVGAHLGKSLLGPRFAPFAAEAQARSSAPSAGGKFFKLFPGEAHALASGTHAAASSPAPLVSSLSLMAAKPGATGGALPARKSDPGAFREVRKLINHRDLNVAWTILARWPEFKGFLAGPELSLLARRMAQQTEHPGEVPKRLAVHMLGRLIPELPEAERPQYVGILEGLHRSGTADVRAWVEDEMPRVASALDAKTALRWYRKSIKSFAAAKDDLQRATPMRTMVGLMSSLDPAFRFKAALRLLTTRGVEFFPEEARAVAKALSLRDQRRLLLAFQPGFEKGVKKTVDRWVDVYSVLDSREQAKAQWWLMNLRIQDNLGTDMAAYAIGELPLEDQSSTFRRLEFLALCIYEHSYNSAWEATTATLKIFRKLHPDEVLTYHDLGFLDHPHPAVRHWAVMEWREFVLSLRPSERLPFLLKLLPCLNDDSSAGKALDRYPTMPVSLARSPSIQSEAWKTIAIAMNTLPSGDRETLRRKILAEVSRRGMPDYFQRLFPEKKK